MEQINLNLIPNGINPVCHCSQYDVSRVIRVNLFDGSVPHEIANGETITLNVRKPDNTIVTTSLTASEGNSYVDIVTSEQMCACEGDNLCELQISSAGSVISTLNFIMRVEVDPLKDGIESESVIHNLENMVERMVAEDVADKTTFQNIYKDIQPVINKSSKAFTKSSEVSTTKTQFKYLTKNGVASIGDTYTDWYVTNAVSVNPGSYYMVTASAQFTGHRLYNILDADDNIIAYEDVTGLAVVSIKNKLILIPDGAAKIQLASVTGSTGAAIYQTTFKDVYKYLYDEVVPEFTHMAEPSYKKDSALSSTNSQFTYIGANGNIANVGDTYTNWYTTNKISIDECKFYYVTASAQFNAHRIFQIFDSDNNVLCYEEATGLGVEAIEDKLIYTPKGAAYIQLASVKGESLMKVYSSAARNPEKYWTGKKWVCMGDSLTGVNTRTSIHYFDYIAAKTGITTVNMGAGGTGYKASYAGVGPFYERVSSIPTDADVVTIFGSGNDLVYTLGTPSDTGTDTLCGCINTTIAAIFNRITTCQLGIVTPCPWEAYNPENDTNAMAKYSEAIVEICRRWGIPCLDLYHCSNLRPWDADFRAAAYTHDDGNGVHPDETGHKIIAPRFEAFLNSLLL